MIILLFLSVVVFASEAMLQNSLKIVTIKEWSGEDCRRTDVLENPVPMVVIQHTVTPECNNDEACEDTVRSIRNYHIHHLGMADIAYSFTVGGNGKVYEGAGWNLAGTHTKGYNTKSVGIAFIGDFREKLPTPEALKAGQEIIQHGVENGHLPEDYKLFGHRQLSNTISPGDVLQKLIETWPNWSDTLP